MNKKKIVKISAVVASVVVILVAGIVGVNAYIRHRNVVETGNLLGVEWYNETDPQFTITTVEQLYELAELSDFYNFKGQTIKLGADLVVNEGNAEDWAEEAPAKRWNPITGFAGTFDGQNHTISGLYGKGFERRMALFADTQMSCSVKNLSLTNSYFETTGHRGTASIVSHGGGKFKKIYSDAIIVHKGENVGGIASTIDVQSTFEECWFDGDINITSRDCGGIIDEVLGARVTVKHCLFSGYIYSSYDVGGTRTGGIFGRTDKAATIVLSDSLSSGKIECEKTVYTGAMLGASYNGVQFTIEDTYTSTETYGTAIGESGKKGTFTGTALQMRESELTGVKAYQWTTLNFDSYWAVVEGGTPILKCFAETVPSLEGVKKVYDTSWYIQGGFDFTLMTREQLYGFFIKSASTDYKDCKVKLGADIVVNEGDASKWAKEAPEMPWFPIATFAGQFDGQGHTISGLYTKTSGSYVGLFGQATAPSVIQNVSLKNSYFEKTGTSAAFMGSIVGDTYGIVQNIYSNAIIVSEGNQVGGIVGRLNDNDKTMSNMRIDGEDYSVMSNCWFDGSITMLAWEEENTGACEAGGLVGRVVQGDAIIEHCLNTGTISSKVTGRALMVGGLVGYVVNAGQLQITDCLNVGEIKTDYTICVGSVIGRANTAERIVTVKDTYATKESFEKAAISKNSLKATVKGDVICVDKSWIVGKKGYQFTTLDFDKYWTVVVAPDGTPILSQFASKKPSVKGLAKLVDISWYKADAKAMVIDSVADLYGLAMLSSTNNFEGKTIKLVADITVNPVDAATLAAWVNKAAVAPNAWMTIGSSAKPFAGTFDGQGHTISGVYSVTDEQYNGLFGATTPTSMIKNLSLKNSYFAFNGKNLTEEGKEAVAYMGSIAGDLRGDMDTVYSNAIVTSTANQVGGLVGRANGAKGADGKLTTCTIHNCWFDGKVKLTGETARYAGGIAAVAVQGTIEITNCLNTGDVSNERNLKDGQAQFLGGILGTEWSKCTVNISDCISAGQVTAAEVAGIGAIVSRIQKAGSVCTIKNTYAMKGSCVNTANNKDVILWSKHKNAIVENGTVLLAKSELLGVEGYKWTNLNFDEGTGYWVTRVNDIPALRSFVASNDKQSVAGVLKPDTGWYDKASQDTVDYYIDTEAELLGLAKLVNSGITFKGKTIHLTADLDMNPSWNDGDQKKPDNTWVPIGQYKTAVFDGTFDGKYNGKTHSISGIYCVNDKTDESYVGFFGVTGSNSKIQNVILLDSYFNRTTPYSGKYAFMGSIAGEVRGTLDTVYSKATVESSYSQVGGLVARANGMKVNEKFTTVNIKNCWYDGNVKLSGENGVYAAGIVAVVVQGTVDMENCLNTGNVVSTGKDSGKMYLGGIIATDWNTSNVNLTNCLNAGEVKADGAENFMGSVYGRRNKAGSIYTLVNTYATNDSCKRTNPDTQVEEPKATGGGETGTKTSGSPMLKDDLNGVKGYTDTLLDFEEYWVARTSDVPALKSFVATGALNQNEVASIEGVQQNNWYDDNVKVYYIGTATALKGFSDSVNNGTNFSGKTVYLTKDIDLNPGWTAPADTTQAVSGSPEEWVPIGNNVKVNNANNRFQGTFDGQGNAIKGIYVDSSSSYVGLFGYVNNNATIKNLRLTNSYFNGDSASALGWGSIVGQSDDATLLNIYSDAVMCYLGRQIGGLVGRSNNVVTVERCWFDGEIDASYVKANGDADAAGVGGIAGVTAGGSLNITDCLNTGKVKSTATHSTNQNTPIAIGGIFGTDWAASTVIISGCLNKGQITTVLHQGVGAIVGRVQSTGSVFEITDCYALKTSIANRTFEDIGYINTSKNPSVSPDTQEERCPSKEIQQLVGADIYKDVTEGGLNLNYGVWVARTSDVPVPRCFVGTIVKESDTVADTTGRVYADTSWLTDGTGDGTATNPYKLDSAGDFLGFAQLVNAGDTFSGKTIQLTDDINMNEGWTVTLNETTGKLSGNAPKNAWTPIGYDGKVFTGTFDGGEHTISGIYCVTTGKNADMKERVGLFGTIQSGGVVKDLKLTNSYFYSDPAPRSDKPEENRAYMGSVVGELQGTLDRVYSDSFIISTGQLIGGLVGYIDATNGIVTVKNSWFDGQVRLSGTNTALNCGGVVGFVQRGTVNIVNSLFSGEIVYKGSATSLNIGGILGSNNLVVTINLKNCLSTGRLVLDGDANRTGSVIGRFAKSGSVLTVQNSYATNECFAKGSTPTSYGQFVSGTTHENISETSHLIAENDIKGDLANSTSGIPNLFTVADFAGETEVKWTTLKVQNKESQIQDITPILKDFETWWLTHKELVKVTN